LGDTAAEDAIFIAGYRIYVRGKVSLKGEGRVHCGKERERERELY